MKRRSVLASLGTLAVLSVLLLYRSVGWAQFTGPVSDVKVDFAHPDALVRTSSLTQLPRDLLKLPLAHDLLTEDLLFYYEERPDRLGLKGSLRRIAYEHDLKLGDEILAWVLDQPAEVALWRAADGRLRYWLIAMTRPELARVLHEAAVITMKDRQLTQAGEIDVDGTKVEVLALEVSPTRTLLLVARGDRVVVLSEPGLLFDRERTPRPLPQEFVGKLLSSDPQRRAAYAGVFRLPAVPARHSVLVGTRYLSFGYQRFFPGVEALRFDFGEGGWSTLALLEAGRLAQGALDDRELWTGLPSGAAACALLPADWRQGAELLEGAPSTLAPHAAPLLAALEGPAAVCWYPHSRLQAPLFTATLKTDRADLDPLLASLFDWGVRRQGGVEKPPHPRRAGDAVVWQRTVEVPFARLDADGQPEPGPLTVTLARQGRHLFFSPDSARVDQALAAVSKRYPSLADSLPARDVTLGIVTPKPLSELAESEAMLMLPPGAEPILRGAAERLLLPRLAAVGKYPPYRLTLAEAARGHDGWQAVEWQELPQ
jgi:uncharacterized protein YfaA (DUF2138 family)